MAHTHSNTDVVVTTALMDGYGMKNGQTSTRLAGGLQEI